VPPVIGAAKIVGVSGTATSGGLWDPRKSGRAASQPANVAMYALKGNTTPTGRPAYRTTAGCPAVSSDEGQSRASQPLRRRVPLVVPGGPASVSRSSEVASPGLRLSLNIPVGHDFAVDEAGGYGTNTPHSMSRCRARPVVSPLSVFPRRASKQRYFLGNRGRRREIDVGLPESNPKSCRTVAHEHVPFSDTLVRSSKPGNENLNG
jgi:hypothetical protein